MKISCECLVINRLQPQLKGRAMKSTLAIGSHPPNKENAEHFLLLFTSLSKTGQRYKIKDNIVKVFTRFAAEGKITISCKTPEHDLQIKCCAIELKSFLQALKMTMDGKKPADFRLPSVASVTKHEPIKTKLLIHTRSDYPIRGFPKTIKFLEIIGLNSCRVDSQIFQLKNLTHLNVSNNNIDRVPVQLGSLPIQVLNFSRNNLGAAASWKWLQGKEISSSLYKLDISENNLTHFPYPIVKLRYLAELNLNLNQIRKVPFAVKRLKILRHLNLCNNQLESVPAALSALKLELMDLCGNKFHREPRSVTRADSKVQKVLRNVPSLLELAGRVVKLKSLPYSAASMPWILEHWLDEGATCNCGNICYDSPIFEAIKEIQFTKVSCLVLDNQLAVMADHVFCSMKCLTAAKVISTA